MRRNTFLTFLKEKAFLIVLTLMLVSAGTMAALFAFGTNETVEKEQQAKQVEIQTKTPLAEEAEENTEAAEQETAEKLPKVTVIKRTTDANENILENTASNAENMENAVMEAELEDQFLEAEVQEELEELAEVSGEDVIAEGFMESIYDISEGFKEFFIGLIINIPYIIVWAVVIAIIGMLIGLLIIFA